MIFEAAFAFMIIAAAAAGGWTARGIAIKQMLRRNPEMAALRKRVRYLEDRLDENEKTDEDQEARIHYFEQSNSEEALIRRMGRLLPSMKIKGKKRLKS